MRVPALVMVMVLVATPALPQAGPPLQADGDARPIVDTVAEVADDLQRVFDLAKLPGFHPELLELLEIEVTQEPATTDEKPKSGGLKTWHWILIGVGAFLVLAALAAPCGFQKSC